MNSRHKLKRHQLKLDLVSRKSFLHVNEFSQPGFHIWPKTRTSSLKSKGLRKIACAMRGQLFPQVPRDDDIRQPAFRKNPSYRFGRMTRQIGIEYDSQ